MADAAQKAFDRFDTNKDGEISLAELKEGLEKSLKIELSDKRAKELMEAFDASGDGALQIDEMVTIDRFRNKLESLVREEKRLALEAEGRGGRKAGSFSGCQIGNSQREGTDDVRPLRFDIALPLPTDGWVGLWAIPAQY